MLFAVGLAMGILLPAEAASNGEISIVPRNKEEAISGGSVTVSRVGIASGTDYQITGKTGNWFIAADELFLPETVTWIRKHAKAKEITQEANEEGVFRFSGLGEGLYLVTQNKAQEAYAPFQPFLVELPVGGEVWKAEAYPQVHPISSENPKTADHPAPIIAAMGLALSASVLFLLVDGRRK